MIELVTATRLDPEAFAEASPLATSLLRLGIREELKLRVAYENKASLSEHYNAAIDQAPDDGIIVFVHDDLEFLDGSFPDQIRQGLIDFDIIGLAGNRRRQPDQASWHWNPLSQSIDRLFLSGSIGHGTGSEYHLTEYGLAPTKCRLLDGVFLAARAATLRRADVHFDPRFHFHHYDLDFCRSAEAAGLTLGTWPIRAVHRSGGNFNSPEWQASCTDYFAKWTD